MTSKEKEKYNLLLDAILKEKEDQLKSAEKRLKYYTREIDYLKTCIETMKDTFKIEL